MRAPNVIAMSGEIARLKCNVRMHFKQLGFTKDLDGKLVPPGFDKQHYRNMHAHQRNSRIDENHKWIGAHAGKLIQHFASGSELDVEKIQPTLLVVYQDTWQSDLFRLASYYWRIPISQGYGRRIRFLVWDGYHEKLIGIFALGDAVFNLRALVNLMDAYALGAVPPYNMLLGGKLIASLIPTRDVVRIFKDKYRDSVGIITGERKNPDLVAVTTTSALGRSSIYNRLRLEGQTLFQPIGFSSGWGHFHISDTLFGELKDYLDSTGDSYANSHGYGQGSNFRLRVIKKAFSALGMDPDLARHGLAREVFFCPIASNVMEVLRGDHKRARYTELPDVTQMSKIALDRWVIPRAKRMPDFVEWKQEHFLREITTDSVPGNQLRLFQQEK